jgi:tRNA(fMet)-specific endonuclease VapC
MKTAIDTNRLTDFLRGEPTAVELVQRCQLLFVPFIVVGEMRCGFLGGTQSLRNETRFSGVLASSRVSILLGNEDTTHHYARLFVQLWRQGTPIPTNDLWIAALCLQNDLPLFTRDQHFEVIPQLQCL